MPKSRVKLHHGTTASKCVRDLLPLGAGESFALRMRVRSGSGSRWTGAMIDWSAGRESTRGACLDGRVRLPKSNEAGGA